MAESDYTKHDKIMGTRFENLIMLKVKTPPAPKSIFLVLNYWVLIGLQATSSSPRFVSMDCPAFWSIPCRVYHKDVKGSCKHCHAAHHHRLPRLYHFFHNMWGVQIACNVAVHYIKQRWLKDMLRTTHVNRQYHTVLLSWTNWSSGHAITLATNKRPPSFWCRSSISPVNQLKTLTHPVNSITSLSCIFSSKAG